MPITKSELVKQLSKTYPNLLKKDLDKFFDIFIDEIKLALKNYENKFLIIKVPVISEVVYGRKVGYKISKIKLSKNIENISATKIRALLNHEKKSK